MARGMAELYKERNGVCYDNSYALEQFLETLGYEIRHVFWLYPYEKQNFIFAMISKKSKSHAALEVRTARGWLYIETLSDFIALDSKMTPYTAKDINSIFINGQINENTMNPPQYLNKKNFIIYGLYSRNGQLFPPFTIVPDYNVRQLLYNLFP